MSRSSKTCFTTAASYYASSFPQPGTKPTARNGVSRHRNGRLNKRLARRDRRSRSVARVHLARLWPKPRFLRSGSSALRRCRPLPCAVRGREAAGGAQIPVLAPFSAPSPSRSDGQPGKPESDQVIRAKSLLFFFALQDRYGEEHFRTRSAICFTRATSRRLRSTDLFSAFDQETHQTLGEFVAPPG